jgi:hypothetical protein
MPRQLRNNTALALQLALRTKDEVVRERLIALAAKCLAEADEKERANELIQAQTTAGPKAAIRGQK